MALNPWYGGFGGMTDPWSDPFGFGGFGGGMDLDIDRPFRRRMMRRGPDTSRALKELATPGSLRDTADEFQVQLDVGHFLPNEITVKTTDDDILVHGKHDERSDEYGHVQREFRRRYRLPEHVKPESVSSTLSSDGVLTIHAPKTALSSPTERIVPITPAPAVGRIEGGTTGTTGSTASSTPARSTRSTPSGGAA